jgi:single-strand selective monofunctional uracil DNA glycosylase
VSLIEISRDLVDALSGLSFGPPVSHLYNPLDYAWDNYRTYLERWGAAPKEVVLLGMNPGPWGMAQTGVPFGEVEAVRDWLEIDCPVGAPVRQHPKRPVEGLDCPRREVSGQRLWGWARATFGSPEAFFARFFVANYCPLAFLEASGRNRTPDRLPKEEREPLLSACDEALRRSMVELEPRIVVAVGAFAESRARIALESFGVTIGRILHPSPASPAANRGWAATAHGQMEELGIKLPRARGHGN